MRSEKFCKFLALVIVVLVTEYMVRDVTFNGTIPVLKQIEQNRTPVMNIVFKAISELSDKYAYIVILCMAYHLFDTPDAFLLTAHIYTCLGVLSVIKSVYHEARPFFVVDIVPTKCWLEYGNPSGHTLTSSSLYLTFWHLFFKKFKSSPFLKYTSLAFTLFVCFLIAFSRIYHGVHTFN